MVLTLALAVLAIYAASCIIAFSAVCARAPPGPHACLRGVYPSVPE